MKIKSIISILSFLLFILIFNSCKKDNLSKPKKENSTYELYKNSQINVFEIKSHKLPSWEINDDEDEF